MEIYTSGRLCLEKMYIGLLRRTLESDEGVLWAIKCQWVHVIKCIHLLSKGVSYSEFLSRLTLIFLVGYIYLVLQRGSVIAVAVAV